MVEEPVPNEISSSRVGGAGRGGRASDSSASVATLALAWPPPLPPAQVRHELEQGRPVKYLVPEAVQQYIYQHGLYGSSGAAPRLARLAHPQVDSDREQ